jgi:hypothetical protein
MVSRDPQGWKEIRCPKMEGKKGEGYESYICAESKSIDSTR